ncbi:MAG: hypothetical protein K6F76_08385 [Clostridiales bacterium]|nr:hypothetical protein [Clostridiales bacterium]
MLAKSKLDYFLKIICVTVVCAVLCSCSMTGFNSTDIMRPPKSTGERAEIEAAIETAVNGDYTLKYPQSGDYRSSVIIFDLDNDSDNEAIAFVSKDTGDAAGISLLFIDNTESGYKCINEFTVAAAEVDKVTVIDIDNDGTKELLIGWSVYSSQIKTLTAYSYNSPAAAQLICEETYSELVIADIDSDSKDDVLLFSLASAEKPASAKLIKMSESSTALYSATTVAMNADAIKYSALSFGKINDNVSGYFIDAITVDSNTQTQVIYLDESGSLQNPLFSTDSEAATNPTSRSAPILSSDVNNDGITEIPIPNRLHSSSLSENETLCDMYDWCNYNIYSSSLDTAVSAVYDPNGDYYFKIPENWEDMFTAVYNSSDNSITFKKLVKEYSSDSVTTSDGEIILEIRKFKEDEFSSYSGYTQIKKSSDSVYAYKTYISDSDEFYISQKNITDSFILSDNL